MRDGVDLTIRGPERIALTGPNGAGKSTLLRLINGELEPDGGDGQAGRRPGRVPVPAAGPAGPDDRTVAENLAAFAPAMPDGASG